MSMKSHIGFRYCMIIVIAILIMISSGDNNGFWSLNINGVADGLSMNYYMFSCPMAEMIVKNTVHNALQSDPTLAAALLRMHFHDCFIQGCDASVLIDSTKDNVAEKDSPANLSLRGYIIIDDAKEQLENQCPGVVSCADILAMAARDAVFFAGGPVYDIPKGRKDGSRSKIMDTINLPPPTLNSSELVRMFSQRGFTAKEMVALSGAHTLGMAKCSSFKSRLNNFDSTHDSDPSLDTQFARVLSKTCSAGANAEQTLDSTRNTFDNDYFNALQMKAGVLFSDQTLFVSDRTRGIVNGYAMNQAMFFFDFQRAVIKMGLLDIKEGSEGEMRSWSQQVVQPAGFREGKGQTRNLRHGGKAMSADMLAAAESTLSQSTSSLDELLPLLGRIEGLLSKVEQSPAKSMQTATSQLMGTLIPEDFLKHSDVDVKVGVTFESARLLELHHLLLLMTMTK